MDPVFRRGKKCFQERNSAKQVITANPLAAVENL